MIHFLFGNEQGIIRVFGRDSNAKEMTVNRLINCMDAKANRSLIIERVFYFANRIISLKTAISRKKEAKFPL